MLFYDCAGFSNCIRLFRDSLEVVTVFNEKNILVGENEVDDLPYFGYLCTQPTFAK